jgi:hypothetical protein
LGRPGRPGCSTRPSRHSSRRTKRGLHAGRPHKVAMLALHLKAAHPVRPQPALHRCTAATPRDPQRIAPRIHPPPTNRRTGVARNAPRAHSQACGTGQALSHRPSANSFPLELRPARDWQDADTTACGRPTRGSAATVGHGGRRYLSWPSRGFALRFVAASLRRYFPSVPPRACGRDACERPPALGTMDCGPAEEHP